MSKSRADLSQIAGFTLIEIVVTLAIAGLGLSFLMMAVGTGLENARVADQFIEATRRAQSHLAGIGSAVPLRPGEQTGDDGGGYSWRLRISEPVLSAAQGEARALGLYDVEIVITWRKGNSMKQVELRSMQIQRAGDGSGDKG